MLALQQRRRQLLELRVGTCRHRRKAQQRQLQVDVPNRFLVGEFRPHTQTDVILFRHDSRAVNDSRLVAESTFSTEQPERRSRSLAAFFRPAQNASVSESNLAGPRLVLGRSPAAIEKAFPR